MQVLHNYQLNAVKFILDKKKVALFIEMGLGKTIISLTAINYLIEKNLIKKVLIIAPLRVANTVWHNEILKWKHLKNLKISIVTGSKKNKLLNLKKQAHIYITNRENTEWILQNQNFDYDFLILDESSSFKSPKTNRFKALKKANVTNICKYIILLSGTPSPNGYLDLWSQYFLLDNGIRLGNKFTSYKYRFFNQSYNGFSWNLKKESYNIINEKIKDITLSLQARDYIDLPNKIILKEYVELNKEIYTKYKELEKDFILELEKDTIDAVNSAVLSNKLLQFCNGAIYDNNKKIVEIHNTKLNLLKDIILENPLENYLIAYNYKYDIDRIINFLGKDVIVFDGNNEQVKKWNNREIKILLCHPKSSGHGLNLQDGGNNIIWFGLNWSLELYQQFNARLYRQGQLKPVKIIHLLIKNSIEDKLLLSLENKNITQSNLLNFLKQSFKK